jgi:serine/threonine-protein kinase CHEK2
MKIVVRNLPHHTFNKQMITATSGIPHAWGRLLSFNGASLKMLDLTLDTYKVGRDPSCDIVLPEAECSKCHFTVYKVGDVPCLMDRSSHGTVVNGTLVHNARTPLQHGSEILIKFDSHFVFLSPDLLESKPEKLIRDRFYVFDCLLGTGAFAVVKLAIDIETLERYACKVINVRSMQVAKSECQTAIEGIQKEVQVLRSLSHPNIVSVDYGISSSLQYITTLKSISSISSSSESTAEV